MLPQLTPGTDLGLAAVRAYAGRQGVDVDAFVQSMAPVLTAEQVGKTVLDIATGGCSVTTPTRSLRPVPQHLIEEPKRYGENWEDSPDGYPQTAPYEWWNWHDAYRSRESSRSDGGGR